MRRCNQLIINQLINLLQYIVKKEFSENGFKIDVQENILTQFARQLAIPIIDNKATLSTNFGKGAIQFYSFPNNLELYHVQFNANESVTVNSLNPKNSKWLLLNINLSTKPIYKTVNTEQVSIQKYLPSGMLFYTPQTKVYSQSPPNTIFEIALIRFPKSFLVDYLSTDLANLLNAQKAIIYEDLDNDSEQLLVQALQSTANKFKKHSQILSLLSIFFDKLMQRQKEADYHNLHPTDLKNLFIAAAQLRNPLIQRFKQVFGSPPIKYHQKIRMEYAQKELQSRQKTISEISYALGYSHPSKFTVAYKKQFNKLPSQV